MENTLSTNSLNALLSSWTEFSSCADFCAEACPDVNVEIVGLKGSLAGAFVARLLERLRVQDIHRAQYQGKTSLPRDLVIVTAGQKEADSCQTDIEAFIGNGADVIQLPWWGMLPYRPSAKGSVVFGQRAGALSKLSHSNSGKRPRIFITTIRALLTPVPPPSYIRSMVLTVRKGQRLDVQALAERLSAYGYVRVPKVGMRGEFALRGEVLDVFMSGESCASRIVFDFDTVEQIKSFDAETQSSRETLDELTVYPMKEVLWTEELCARLETLLAREDSEGIENGFAAYDRARTDSGSKTGAGFVAQETQAGLENDTHLEVSLAAEADTAGSCVKNDTDSDFFYEGRGDSLQKSTYSRCLDGAASSNAGGAVCQSASTGTETSQKAVHLSLTEHAKKERDRLLLELLELGESEGEELFYGLLWDTKSSVLDYAKNSTVMFFDFDRLCNAEQLLRNEFAVSYRTVRQRLPVLSPREMLLDFSRIVSGCRNAIRLRTLETEEATQDPVAPCSGTDEAPLFASSSGNAPPPKVKAGTVPHVFRMQSEPGQSYFGNINYLKEQLVSLQKDGWHIFVFADNPNQALRIREVLKDVASDFEDGTFPAQVLPTAISEGFSVSGQKILVIQENEIFGRRKAVPKSSRRAKSRAIDTFVDLNPGDFVVHVQYGIGCFKGIERVKANGTERDYIKLLYAEDETVFIPIEQVNMVQRYIGSEKEHPRLDRIGSKSWSARKAKVQKKAEEMAARLVDLYSKRKASRGFPFPKDSEWQAAFEAAFPYEDTPDQLTATEDIKADMERPVPMDRLVCGDVGYGKTEIAMRAAFKAVMGGKQVAFLAPTTILAEQHFETCTERFKNFPVSVAQLSRFVSQAEQKKTLAKLASGEVDILIGTHRILQKDVVFKDLGLMIVDEEQRFGVKDKERLKALKTNIDSLAMSATPIPRTLHMSLLKIRDMSLLTTPPQNRQSIETVIEGYDGERVARAIRSEVGRGGQVFFLHNRVETLEETRHSLEQLVPEMLIDVAHGQMGADELDDIFRRFKMGGFHVLVATTIIENGIDIPNVNTIIIDRADMYGVSQLYQLRGRVGRSDRKAYAYLFYPENKALSEVAMKRLQVISDFTELGSGFKIAMKDMEIRGAGNLLGRDQSGDVYAVGFEMYLNLLNAAIERLVDENWHAPDEVLLELEYTGFIPDSYVSGAETKMEIYKKIAAIQSDDELSSMYAELYDRFGPIPGEAESLLDLAKIRIICHKLSISTLREKNGVVQVEFSEVAKVNVDKVLGLIKTSAGRVRLDPAHPNRLLMQTGPVDLSSKSGFIREKLSRLA